MNKLPPRTRFFNNHNQTEKYHVRQQSPDTRDWLTVQSRASHNLSKYAVFYAILDKEKDVVVKVGPDVLKTEYAIGKELETLGLPTFISYYYLFDCLDDKDILFDKKKIPDYFCKHGASYRMHALVMPTIKGEPIENIKWTRTSFNDFKCVLKHITMSLFVAMDECGFIHNDLHTGNILLEKSKHITINYGLFGALSTCGHLPIIMDYDMSKINVKSVEMQMQLYKDLARYISNACVEQKELTINFDAILNLLNELRMHFTEPTPDVCNDVCDAIDKMEIKFAKSELKSQIFYVQ